MRGLWLSILLLLYGMNVASAQDARPRTEPVFPRVCATLVASLRSDADGPVAGSSAADEDRESNRQTATIARALRHCARAAGAHPRAVRLMLGSNPGRNAFLINPITLPANVGLIVDGGVTVFASRNPHNYQVPLREQNPTPGDVRCGTVGHGWPVYGGCRALVTLSAGSGVYGYGILDGQGQRPMIGNDAPGITAWWDLLQQKKGCGAGCEQASPPMIFAGPFAGASNDPITDVTLYKITLRNPPFHTVSLGGTGITVWGVKVQAPWNVPNSDGFDLHGRNILVHDVTVANGDQDIVLTTPGTAITRNVTVHRATLYSKGGVALLGDGAGFTDIAVDDVAMTGDVASFRRRTDGRVLVNGVDPTAVVLPGAAGHLQSYGQALPSATDDLQGVQIDLNLKGTPAARFSRLAFRSICLQDVVRPLTFAPSVSFAAGEPLPTVSDVTFADVHVLPPSEQFPAMTKGIVGNRPGRYTVEFSGQPNVGFLNSVTLRNVVFNDLPSGATSIGTLAAEGNVLSTVRNIYPRALNRLDRGIPPAPAPAGWTASGNSYLSRAGTFDAGQAVPCPASRWPFLTGELYLSLASENSAGAASGKVAVPADGDITLAAVVQPAMSQTTWYVPESYGVDPGLLAIGSPPLTGAVQFYEGTTPVGRSGLGANGTLATIAISPVSPGRHTYTARYLGDRHYRPFAFGSVVVEAR